MRLGNVCRHDYQPGIYDGAAWRCQYCGTPRPQQNTMQICPAAEDGDDFAAMFCDQAGETCCVLGPAGGPGKS